MASKGTNVHFIWEAGSGRSNFVELLEGLLAPDPRIKTLPGWNAHNWTHETFGHFLIWESRNRDHQNRGGIYVHFSDINLLPELAILEERQENVRVAYRFARELFMKLGCDIACGSAEADYVEPFDFENARISRVFKFSKLGAQQLVLPYEEDRDIRDYDPDQPPGHSDLHWDPQTGECKWVLKQ